MPPNRKEAYRRACSKQLARIGSLRSQTIHSFCQSLLRQFPIEAGLDPQGELKEKCMMGPKADCDRCGCVVPFYMASLTHRRFIVEDTVRELTFAARRAAAGVLTAVLG